MIILEEYLNEWLVHYSHAAVPEEELTQEIRRDAQTTVDRANQLLDRFGEERGITSGWRPVEVNKLIPNAAKFSNHTVGRAVDIADPHGDLDEWCLANAGVLEEIGLWQEHPAATKGWCHVQIVPPKSGNRVFYP